MDEPEEVRVNDVIALLYPGGDKAFREAVERALGRSWTFPLTDPAFPDKFETELRKEYLNTKVRVGGPGSIGTDRGRVHWRVYRDG